TGNHVEAVRRYATASGKKTLLLACERAVRGRNQGRACLGALRAVAAAWNRLHARGFFGPPDQPPSPPDRLDLAAIDHLAALSPGGGSVTHALTRRIRELEAKVRGTGEALENFVGEDKDEGAGLAAMSRDLIAFADAGTRP